MDDSIVECFEGSFILGIKEPSKQLARIKEPSKQLALDYFELYGIPKEYSHRFLNLAVESLYTTENSLLQFVL
jgi:hypothetical protein